MALTPKKTDKNSDQGAPKAPELSAEDEIALREIDEAVRADDAAEFAKKYGVPIGSAVAVILLAVGGYLFWDSRVEGALEKDSEQIVSIMDYDEARQFDQVKERSAPLLDSETIGVRTSARFVQATAALETGESARAIELYAQIAADSEVPQALRDFATLREVTTNFDERKPADIIARLKDLAVPGHALYGSAAELSAVAHLEAGDEAEAGKLYAAIANDEDLPESLRDRARQMTGQLGVDAVEDVEKVLEEQGVAPQGAAPSAPQG